MRRLLLTVSIVLALPMGPIEPAHAQPAVRPEDARAAAARIHDEGDYADGLAIAPSLEGDQMPFGGDSVDDGRTEPVDDVSTSPREGTAGSWRMPMPEWLRELLAMLGDVLSRLFAVFGVLAQPIAYLVIGSLVVLMVLLVVGLVAMIRFPARAAQRGSADATEAAQRRDPLLDELTMSAEEFARAGRFGEAIHALFLRSLKRAVQLDGRASESTARELVEESPDPLRPPLALLLEATELVWFGGRTASRDDYERALSIEHELRA